jgi:hypothetical protein
MGDDGAPARFGRLPDIGKTSVDAPPVSSDRRSQMTCDRFQHNTSL